MAVDYLSAMNVGSGLNVTQIVDALVDAEKAPREAQLNENIEEKTVSISAFAEVKQEFEHAQNQPCNAWTIFWPASSNNWPLRDFDCNLSNGYRPLTGKTV